MDLCVVSHASETWPRAPVHQCAIQINISDASLRTMLVNRQIVLAERPAGMPKETDFRLVESPIPHPGAGEVLVRALYLSVDPYMRGRMTGQASYARGLQPGEVILGGVVGRVVDSNDPRVAKEDI